MPSCFDKPLNDFEAQVDAVRANLAAADTASLVADRSSRDRAAAQKAMAYVWLGAAIEQFWVAVLGALANEVNAIGLRLDQLRFSLIALHEAPRFDALADLAGLKNWSKRIELLEECQSTSLAALPTNILPTDGGTIRPKHVELIWSLYGFPGGAFPSPLHRLALRDLADGRNEVAHGGTDPIKFGRSKQVDDIRKLLQRVDEQATHFCCGIDDYLKQRKYLR